ncbi:hypothetical protein [Nocardia donostiensis]|uniref:Uncharacterized protein n=1 Tax=Nocardia donostiensis TaxID=1538463 RepID=A0A1V2TDN9_9NOCA|nr:hypothetical protein [Nocardia donostiensis]ONM47461.1 hypothetical protein B0T46_18055 [Nocardia donostiensis]OQS17862.1 hypothetical protein B0T44_22535 [Nocardia donostiensis]
MSYNHVLLPSGVASTPAEVDAYLVTQQGLPATESIAAIAAEVNRRNTATAEEDRFLSAEVGGDGTGDVLAVPSPYDAIGFARALLFELATPLHYAVYDPQLTWLIDPAGHVSVTVTHGGAGEFPYLTKPLAEHWVRELADPNPYLIAEKADQVYIQTYRHSEDDFALEYRDGSADRHFATTVNGADEVAALIWGWANDDRTRLDTLQWSRLDL